MWWWLRTKRAPAERAAVENKSGCSVYSSDCAREREAEEGSERKWVSERVSEWVMEAKKGGKDERERVPFFWLIQKERESGRRERVWGREREGSWWLIEAEEHNNCNMCQEVYMQPIGLINQWTKPWLHHKKPVHCLCGWSVSIGENRDPIKMYAVSMQVSKNNGRIVAWNHWMWKQMCGSLIG
jgi:hypothetical protein